MEPTTPLVKLSGIGPALTYKLKRLNLETVEDLIYHFPFRYDDFSAITHASEAKIGETITLQGEIWSIKNVYTRYGKVLTQAIFNDGSTSIILTWFNQGWLTKQIEVGDRLQVSGKLSKYKGKLSIIAPQWEKLPLPIPGMGQVDMSGLHTGRLVPVYPETAGLTSKWLRTKIDRILPQVVDKFEDPFPKNLRDDMLTLPQALKIIHFPKNQKDIEQARERLGFDELFYISLATQKARLEWSRKPVVEALKIETSALKNFIDRLPFILTSAQKRVLEEVIQDLKKRQPMNRLIQGEVGSGKTVVAAITAYLVHLNGLGTLFMTPTEILAFQHYDTIRKLLEPFGITVGIYTGSKKQLSRSAGDSEEGIPARSRRSEAIEDARRETELAGPAQVIVGTHALLSQKFPSENVGLVVVDEQQRFGVEQRTLLRSRAKIPHFLTLTATPIPRTVALTLYGDLDLSVVSEMPKGRPQVKTYLVPERKRQNAYQFIAEKIGKSDQVYIITPLIEPSETLVSVKAAKKEFEALQKIFPQFKLALLHGRMKSKDKEVVITQFRNGEIQILVSTSVVEVGMDIANATVMVIEGAERYGLAQLHQLRGRVGRGIKESFCLLFTTNSDPEQSRRLKYLETTFDGLKLAELDLKIRGAGTIFGTMQHGRFEFKIASLSDTGLVEKTRKAAQELLHEDPSLDKYPALKRKLEQISSTVMPD